MTTNVPIMEKTSRCQDNTHHTVNTHERKVSDGCGGKYIVNSKTGEIISHNTHDDECKYCHGGCGYSK